MHESDLAGHRGPHKMWEVMRTKYYWPGMRAEIYSFVSDCVKCNQAKARTTRPWAALQPSLPPTTPFTHYSCDFIFGLPAAGPLRHDGLMVVVDMFSKSVAAIPVHEAAPAEEMAEAFYRRIVCQRGTPIQITSDRDSRFMKPFWKRLWSLHRTNLKFSTAYTQQQDGQTERVNRVLEEILRCNAQPDLRYAGRAVGRS